VMVKRNFLTALEILNPAAAGRVKFLPERP
jgi:hypothetical protein